MPQCAYRNYQAGLRVLMDMVSILRFTGLLTMRGASATEDVRPFENSGAHEHPRPFLAASGRDGASHAI